MTDERECTCPTATIIPTENCQEIADLCPGDLGYVAPEKWAENDARRRRELEDPDCPIHGESTPEDTVPQGGNGVSEVVGRIERELEWWGGPADSEANALSHTDDQFCDLLRDALTLIHDLQAERDAARGGIDRLVTENISYTTRIGELEAENERLREAILNVSIHTARLPAASNELLHGLLDSITRITRQALTGEQNDE